MNTSALSELEKIDYMAPKFKLAYEFLHRTDLADLPAGEYPIDGDNVYAQVQDYVTEPESRRFWETHKVYFDVHYLVSGEEKIGYCPGTEMHHKQPYNEADEMYLYGGISQHEQHFIEMKPGDCMIIAPTDGHKPRCAVREGVPVRKIVVKVKADL